MALVHSLVIIMVVCSVLAVAGLAADFLEKRYG